MNIKRIIAIIFIFLLGVGGWLILGSASALRSSMTAGNLDNEVRALWGSKIVQLAPKISVSIPGTQQVRTLAPSRNEVEVDIELEQRRKGLLWYPTYIVDFSGTYSVTNTDAVSQNVRVHFPLPSETATYDRFGFFIDGKLQRIELRTQEGVNQLLELAPGDTRTFKLTYRTRGLREWFYQLAAWSGRVEGLSLSVVTNFEAIDFPEGSLSPMSIERADGATTMRWEAEDLITRQNVGITMPERVNPGPVSTRMSFFAPVCLLFFFVLITALCVLKRIDIHPMHYLFVTAGFFAFHLLFAYLVDLINIHLAFFVSSVISVALMVLYLATALGREFPWKIAAAGQLFYLVLFSYSFFLEGMTGLTVTVGSVLTLAVLMKLTAKLDWSEIFRPNEQTLLTAK